MLLSFPSSCLHSGLHLSSLDVVNSSLTHLCASLSSLPNQFSFLLPDGSFQMQLWSYLAFYFPLWDSVHFIRLQDNPHLILPFFSNLISSQSPNSLSCFKGSKTYLSHRTLHMIPLLSRICLWLFSSLQTPQMPSSLGGLPVSDTCSSSSADPPLNSYNLVSLFA